MRVYKDSIFTTAAAQIVLNIFNGEYVTVGSLEGPFASRVVMSEASLTLHIAFKLSGEVHGMRADQGIEDKAVTVSGTSSGHVSLTAEPRPTS